MDYCDDARIHSCCNYYEESTRGVPRSEFCCHVAHYLAVELVMVPPAIGRLRLTCSQTLPSGANGNNNDDLQAFQLIVLATYLLGVPKP